MLDPLLNIFLTSERCVEMLKPDVYLLNTHSLFALSSSLYCMQFWTGG